MGTVTQIATRSERFRPNTGSAQLVYRNLAVLNIWLMLQAMDPELPAWDDLTPGERQRCSNDLFDAAMRTWWRQTEDQ
jgi:hypothetical protein